MSTDFKVQRLRLLSGSATGLLVPVADSPVTVLPAGTVGFTPTGRIYKSSGGGSWTEVGDTAALSGTINSAIVSLSGTINARFLAQGSGVSTTGSMALSDVSPGGAIDLRVSGTFDWLIPYSATPKITTGWYGKAAGGWLFESYQWIGTTGPTEVDTRSWTMTADTKDSTLQPAPNGTLANMYGRGMTSLNHGYVFKLPCHPAWKRVIMQGTQHDDNVSLSASFNNSPGSAQVLSSICTNGAGRDYRFAIDFCGPEGMWLNVKVIVEANVPAGGGGVNHLYCHSIACWWK